MNLITAQLHFREALVSDIGQIFKVRFSVTENALSNPALVTYNDNVDYLTNRGKGWICETENDGIVGFAIADLKGNSIWALFVMPEFEGLGIGKKLQELMLDWYFKKTKQTLWLETAANTKAERFYNASGWIETHRENRIPSLTTLPMWTEIRFEMTYEDWKIMHR